MGSCETSVMLCYVMLCYVMLCYVMLCYVVLCYFMSRNIWYQIFCYVAPNARKREKSPIPLLEAKNCFAIQILVSIRILVLWCCDPTQAMAYSFMRFQDHTRRRTTVGRTPLDE